MFWQNVLGLNVLVLNSCAVLLYVRLLTNLFMNGSHSSNWYIIIIFFSSMQFSEKFSFKINTGIIIVLSSVTDCGSQGVRVVNMKFSVLKSVFQHLYKRWEYLSYILNINHSVWIEVAESNTSEVQLTLNTFWRI